MINFAQSKPIKINAERALVFAKKHDRNKAHITAEPNLVLPKNSVSGLHIVTELNLYIQSLPEFENLMCAKSLSIKWILPVCSNYTIRFDVSWFDKKHKTKNYLFERHSECAVINCSTSGNKCSTLAIASIIHILSKSQ